MWTFHLYVATFQQHLHMEYISLSWYDIPELVVPIRISLIEGCCEQGSYLTKGSSLLGWSHHFESFTVAIIQHSIPESIRFYCHSTFHSRKHASSFHSTFHSRKHASLLLFNIPFQKAFVFIVIQHFIPESIRLYCYSTFHSRKHASLLLFNIPFQKAFVFIAIQHSIPESIRTYCYSTFHSRRHASLLLFNISFQKAFVFIVI